MAALGAKSLNGPLWHGADIECHISRRRTTGGLDRRRINELRDHQIWRPGSHLDVACLDTRQ